MMAIPWLLQLLMLFTSAIEGNYDKQHFVSEVFIFYSDFYLSSSDTLLSMFV